MWPPIEGGFDVSLVAAIVKKQVPVTVVTELAKADYEISGISQSDKAGWAKMLFLGTEASNEQASIKVLNTKSGDVVFGYNVKKGSVGGLFGQFEESPWRKSGFHAGLECRSSSRSRRGISVSSDIAHCTFRCGDSLASFILASTRAASACMCGRTWGRAK